MNNRYPQRAGINVITLSHQCGSDGEELAARLAQCLEWRLFDREIVAQIARTLEVTEEEVAAHDEQSDTFTTRMLELMQLAFPTLIATTPILLPIVQKPLYQETLHHIIKTIADEGKAVIIGHAAQIVLANRPDVLHIRVCAPPERRIRALMLREEINEAHARAYVLRKDRDCARYYRSQYHRDVHDSRLYDLVIHSDLLDSECTVYRL